jgi:hypothetical protein
MKRTLAFYAALLMIPVAFVAGIVSFEYSADQPATPAPSQVVAESHTLTPSPVSGPMIAAPPLSLDALLESKASVADPIAGYVRIAPEGTAYLQMKAGWKLVSATPKPSATPVDLTLTPDTPTPTIPPTNTAKPSATVTNTPDVEASPTQDDEPQPTPEPGEEKVCLVRNLSGGPYNVRANHASSATIVGQVPTSEYATVVSVYVISDVTNEWFRVTYGNVTGWMIRNDDDLLFGASDTLDICLDTDLTPTEYANNPLPTPVPTQTGPTPTPIPPIIAGCTVTNGKSSNLNTRSGPGLSYAVVGKLAPGESGQAIQKHTDGEEVWVRFGRLSAGGQATYAWVAIFVPTQGNLASLTGPCDGLAEMVAVKTTAGLHTLGFSVRNGDVLAVVRSLGFLKLTDDSYFLATEAKKLNPDILIIHRSIHLIDVGLRNCPEGYGVGGTADAVRVAQSWWSLITRTWDARNLLGPGVISRFEVTNECGAPPATWENAFWLETLRLAKQQSICLAIYSDSYGTPEIEQFVARRPVFDRILSEECRPGERHLISLHTYGNVSSGDYIFGRWKLFRSALRAIDPKYDALQYVFTEFGVTNAAGNNDGRGTADCGRAALETQQAVAEYKKSPEVLGFALFNVGGGSEWLDLTPCLGQIAATLE